MADLGFERPTGVVEPRLVQVVTGACRIGAPDEIGEVGKQCREKVTRALGLLAQLDTLRRIAGDNRETLQHPAIVANGRNAVIATVARTILALVPAVFLVPALSRSNLELSFERLLAVGRIQDRKVPTENLRGGIAIERFGTGIPACHPALGVEHIDGAILDCINDQPSSVFTLAQGLLGEPPGLDVID